METENDFCCGLVAVNPEEMSVIFYFGAANNHRPTLDLSPVLWTKLKLNDWLELEIAVTWVISPICIDHNSKTLDVVIFWSQAADEIAMKFSSDIWSITHNKLGFGVAKILFTRVFSDGKVKPWDLSTKSLQVFVTSSIKTFSFVIIGSTYQLSCNVGMFWLLIMTKVNLPSGNYF